MQGELYAVGFNTGEGYKRVLHFYAQIYDVKIYVTNIRKCTVTSKLRISQPTTVMRFPRYCVEFCTKRTDYHT